MVPDVKGRTLVPFVREIVSKDATIYTDEWIGYNHLRANYEKHETVNHGRKQGVKGEAHTNSIEGFWPLLKGGIRGVYRGRVTKGYIQNYVNEYAFRYNRRKDVTPMFLSFLSQVRKSSD